MSSFTALRRLPSSMIKSAWRNATATPTRRVALGVTLAITAPPLIAIVQGTALLSNFRHLHANAPVPITPSRGVVVAVRNDHHHHHHQHDHDDCAHAAADDDAAAATDSTTTCAASTDRTQFQKTLDMMRKRLEQGGEHWHDYPSSSADTGVLLESPSSSSSSSTSTTTSTKSTSSTSSEESTTSNNASSLPTTMTTTTTTTTTPPPLRILVIGDSLAAGVGVTENATPILPEMIARTLSQNLGGRPVYWTCVGTPGANVTRIIEDIESYREKSTLLVRHTSLIARQDDDDEPESELEKRQGRLVEWWKNRPTRVQEAIKRSEEEDKSRSTSKDDDNKETNDDDDDDAKKSRDTPKNANPIVDVPKKKLQLWGELIQSDWSTLQEAWKGDDATSTDNPSTSSSSSTEAPAEVPPMDPFKLWQRWRQRLQRRTDTTVVGQYDIAIVLTGLNDLKEAVLPFMMEGENSNSKAVADMKKEKSQLQQHATSSSTSPQQQPHDANDTTNAPRLKDEFERVLKTLQNRMNLILDRRHDSSSPNSESGEQVHGDSNKTIQPKEDHNKPVGVLDVANSEIGNELVPGEGRTTNMDDDHSGSNDAIIINRHRPLVVFPALPATAVPIFQSPPLSFFVLPLIRRMDAYKKAIARQFPGEVLFVPAPSVQDLNELEAKTGRLWKASRAEQVLLQLTDVRQAMRDRVEGRMKKHYERWGIEEQQQQARDNDSNNSSSSDNDNGQRSTTNATSLSSASSSVAPRFSSGGYSNSQQEESLSVSEHENNDYDKERCHRKPGQSLVGADRVHPNDKGYEYWGRHIGLAIVREWQVQDEKEQYTTLENGDGETRS